MHEAINFIDLTVVNISFLFIVGFIGGLVSGFIGSGGAFVLTPGMMSLGVPANMAVASNMCHKFPKALVGAYKRFRYGQVDLKPACSWQCLPPSASRWGFSFSTTFSPSGVRRARTST